MLISAVGEDVEMFVFSTFNAEPKLFPDPIPTPSVYLAVGRF